MLQHQQPEAPERHAETEEEPDQPGLEELVPVDERADRARDQADDGKQQPALLEPRDRGDVGRDDCLCCHDQCLPPPAG
jgi:hypothetical protein